MGEVATSGGGATVAISAIVIGERHRQDMGDLRSLADSIGAHGLLHPVVVTPDLRLVAGHRRLEAVRLLGWSEVPVTMIDVDDLLLAERDENAERKDFTPSEAVAIGRIIEERHRAKIAAVRVQQLRAAGQISAVKRGVGNMTKKEIDVPGPCGAADAVASRAVGMSTPSYYRAKKVVAAAEADPEAFGDLPEQMDKTGNVLGAFTEMEHRKAKAGKSNGAAPKAAERHAIHRNTRRLNADKIMESGVRGLEGIALSFDLLNVDELDRARRPDWAASLTASLKIIRRIQKELDDE